MHNRRHFLLQGSLATVAVLMTKPSKATNKLQSWFPQLSADKKYLVIVHGNHLPGNAATAFLSENDERHILLVDTRPPASANENTPPQQEDAATGIRYVVVKKGRRNIGVVYAPAVLTKAAIQDIDTTAGKLKQQHQCQLVICSWQAAAYSSTAKRPEREIAEVTQYIDVFAGTLKAGVSYHPVVVMNQLKKEVMFQYHSGTGSSNTMQIGFDAKGQRNHVSFES